MAGALPNPARIVVVDDNPADVYLIEEALRHNNIGFEMTRFEDGEKAMLALCEYPSGGSKFIPDLILLDLNMPRAEDSIWPCIATLCRSTRPASQ